MSAFRSMDSTFFRFCRTQQTIGFIFPWVWSLRTNFRRRWNLWSIPWWLVWIFIPSKVIVLTSRGFVSQWTCSSSPFQSNSDPTFNLVCHCIRTTQVTRRTATEKIHSYHAHLVIYHLCLYRLRQLQQSVLEVGLYLHLQRVFFSWTTYQI